ncbi:MAG: hypothetical protein A3E91_01120 [Candidatus Moranbacteria bacterium RIFCSPHIGHO2_12_FULL_40_10]|nr:MAG: hypothetical protein A3E91_01120 [Candidatus Moranbacteria bacterium RIFCSPHIGHO2_12_FULL_40_10]
MKIKKKKIRIAILASNVITIPPFPPEKNVPEGWSGAPELVVHYLTEELVRRGHYVTLFASGDSKTKAKLVSVNRKSSWNLNKLSEHVDFEYLLISKVYQMAKKGYFDIIHSHFDIRSAHFAALSDTPTLSTLHSQLKKERVDILKHYKRTQYYASISNNQRKPLPDLRYAITAYNGVNTKEIPFSEKKEDYIVFAGRIHPSKGVKEAIEVAKKSKTKLYIFGSNNAQEDYWMKEIKPNIDGKLVNYMGMVSRSEIFKYLKSAKAFVFPLQWEEPFGLVAVEAMTCGTPVITFNRGSMPEIVKHNETGFIVKSVNEMSKSLEKIDDIDPRACRKHVEENFTSEKMVDRYEKAYHKILNK